MTEACKCDVCGDFFQEEVGTSCIESIHVAERNDRRIGVVSANWSDVDLCKKCTKKLLDVLRPALNGLTVRG